jgi:hypothetical protein
MAAIVVGPFLNRTFLTTFRPHLPDHSPGLKFSVSVNAFHENAVYVKREFAILMLFLLLSFLKPTFLS